MAATQSHWSRGGAWRNYFRGTYSTTYMSAREQRGNGSRDRAAVEPPWRTEVTDHYFPLEGFGGTAEAQRPLEVYEGTADELELLELNLMRKEIQLRIMIQETPTRTEPGRFKRQIFYRPLVLTNLNSSVDS
uniref:Uncharacterized protein n=1 Tax=Knipowitschia caucasica TaxID=637954 RepID=A0AAV2JT98_KNICA